MCLINEGWRSNKLVESKSGVIYEGLKFDYFKNIQYQRVAVYGVVNDIVAYDNVDEDKDGGEVDFEKSTM